MALQSVHEPDSAIPTQADWVGVARSVGAAVRPGVTAADQAGTLDREAFGRLKAAGLTAALVPAELGGGGASHRMMCEALRALGRHDPALAVTLSMHSHLVAFQLWRQLHGMDAEMVLRKVAGGAVLISTGASDWLGSNGRAERADGGYRVWSRKSPASGCEVGDVLVTSFRWDDSPDGPQVLHGSVPFAADGVSIEPTWDTLGLRATGSHTVVLDGVFVPDEAVSLTRPADVWHPVWNIVLGAALPLIMAAYLGVADAAVDLALDGAAGRADAPSLQLAGEMVNAHTLAHDVVVAMANAADDLRFDNTDQLASSMLGRKTIAADALIDTVRLAVELTGGRAYTRGGDLERLYRDVHGCLFHPLPRAKQTHLSGRVAVGLSPVG